METRYYFVEAIDGDYAHLMLLDEGADHEPKLVARALLPADIYEGCKLKYELFQYEMMDL